MDLDNNRVKKIEAILHYETEDRFLKKHIAEINKAYTYHCHTCVFVLSRKVFENLIIGILKTKFPRDPNLYFDRKKNRYQDFSLLLANLFKKRNEFDHDPKKAIERLNGILQPFKKDANEKVHSLYHIVESRREIDDWNLQTIIDLIDIIH